MTLFAVSEGGSSSSWCEHLGQNLSSFSYFYMLKLENKHPNKTNAASMWFHRYWNIFSILCFFAITEVTCSHYSSACWNQSVRLMLLCCWNFDANPARCVISFQCFLLSKARVCWGSQETLIRGGKDRLFQCSEGLKVAEPPTVRAPEMTPHFSLRHSDLGF